MITAQGIVHRMTPGRLFSFISYQGKEYFFHRDDFLDSWEILVNEIKNGPVRVTFESVPSLKGPRASNVRFI